MPTLDLENTDHLAQLNARWRFAEGLIPGQPNGGQTLGTPDSPVRLADYDDSDWEIIDDIKKGRFKGFVFGWYRIAITLPETVDGEAIANKSVFFETCVDDYAELWIDGECDLAFGESGHGAVSGFNAPQRVSVSESAEPGARHVIACLAVNGPFAAPKGGIFMRYARLQFE